MSNNNGKKFAIGAIFAAVAGYVAGILTAPKSGKETREDIIDTVDNTKLEIEKSLKLAHTELKKNIKEAQVQIQSANKELKKDLEIVIKKSKVAETKARETLSALHEGTADNPELESALKEANAAINHFKKFLTSK